MISFQNITLQREQKVLFQSVNLTFYANQKIGLIGRNGSGKSSLFALILNEIQSEIGNLSISPNLKIAHVLQEIPNTEKEAMEYVIDGDTEFRKIEKELKEEKNSEKISKLYMKLEDINGYSINSRAALLLSGLGFSDDMIHQKVNTLSGGWKMRLNLARALICRSDLLLLDEPTNHLDLAAIVWLERWLCNYKGTLILISHDREFLDKIVTKIAHIENQSIKLYEGNYSEFEKQRAENLALQQKLYEKQQKKREHWQSYIDRFRYKATKAKQAQSRIKALEHMKLIDAANIDIPFEFDFFEPISNPNVLLRLNHVYFDYDGNEILKDINLQIESGMRIGLLGLNGAGKSTLLKLLSGKTQPQNGSIETNRKLKVGYFAQYQLDQLNPNESPLNHLQEIDSKTTEQKHRKFLGRFGFSKDMATNKIEKFSGGEKSRLALALIIWQKPNLLLLDEPTNNLDMDMRNALIKALQNYQGSMVLVSHDRYLLNSTTDQLYLVDKKNVSEYDGNLKDYVKLLLQKKTVSIQKEHKIKFKSEKKSNKKQKAQIIEKKLDKSYKALKKIEASLSEPSIYENINKNKLQDLLNAQIDINKEIKNLEKEWFLLNDD